MSCAGDVDGDGYADLLIGAEGSDGATTGPLLDEHTCIAVAPQESRPLPW